jgi:hypothetical protein
MTDRKHAAEYGLLIICFTLGLFIYVVASDFTVKKTIVILLAALYPTWGIWHHWDHGHLSYSIVWEYVLVGFIILVGLLAILH